MSASPAATKPTATKPITSHAWGCVPVKVDPETGEVHVASFLYARKGRYSRRVVMGKGKPGESPRKTMARELKEELAESPLDCRFDVLNFLVYTEICRDERNSSGDHLKGFSVCRFHSPVRSRQYSDGSELDEETHYSVEWMEASKLLLLMNEKLPGSHFTNGFPLHIKAVEAAMNALASDREFGKAVAMRYTKILSDIQVSIQIKASDLERAMEYTDSFEKK